MDTGLVRAGRYVVNRRVALGYKHRIDLAKDLPITDRTLADIENGVREVSLGTCAVLENKLGWAPGSIEAVRQGHEPTEELLLELRRRIVWNQAHFGGDDRGWGALFP